MLSGSHTRKYQKIDYLSNLQDIILENNKNERNLVVWISNNLKQFYRKVMIDQSKACSYNYVDICRDK